MIVNNRKIESLVLLSLFFPFFKILPISAEIQPLGVFFGILIFIFRGRIKKELLLHSLAMFFITIFSLFFITSGLSTVSYSQIATSVVIIYCPILTYLYVKETSALDNKNLFKFILCCWLFICLVQQFAPFLLTTTKIDTLLQIFIPRFLAGTAENGRGVAGLAPEPSYAAYVYLSLFVWSWYLKSRDIISNRESNVFFSILVVLLVLNRSMLAVLVFGFVIFIKFKPSKVITSSILLIVLTYLLFGFDFSGRLWDFLSKLASIDSFSELMLLFQSFSSTREVGVLVGYSSIITSPFGVGVGNGSNVFFDILGGFEFILLERYDDIVDVGSGRPYSYFSFLALELGLGFLIPIFLFLHYNLKCFKYTLRTPGAIFIISMALFLLFFRAPVSMPATTIILAIIVRGLKENRIVYD